VAAVVIELLPPRDAEADPWGEQRPIRPDLPVLRNFSYTKLHALQLGGVVGLFLFWTRRAGYGRVMAAFLTVLVYLLALADPSDHRLALVDVQEKPWYFSTAICLSAGCARLFDWLW